MTKKPILLKQARKVTVVESIVEQLVEQIQSGALNPGDKLPSERQLVDMLGVGRSSVREALQGMVMMGLVEIRPGQGTFIKHNLYHHIPDWSSADLSNSLQRDMRLQLIEARRMIEVMIVATAAQRATEGHLSRLRGAFDDYTDAIVSGDFANRRYVTAHRDFHLALADITQNTFFVLLVDTLLQAVPETLRKREFTLPEDVDLIGRQTAIHEDIMESVVSGDAQAAENAMHAHMDFERDIVLMVYPEQSD